MSGKIYLNNSQFFKPNYYKAIEYIVPKFVNDEEVASFGETTDPTDLIINSHIDVASSISSVLPINVISGTIYSSLNTLEGIAPYFIKQNNLTHITPRSFDLNILGRVGQSLASYNSSSEFSTYLSSTLLPSITRNNVSSYFTLGGATSSAEIILVENLSWLYFLNSSGPSYNPSSFVHNIIVEKLYSGQSIELADCLKGLSEFLWRNNSLSSYVPSLFHSGTGTYTSGIQQLEKFQTWIDVIYSPLHADRADFTVRDRFETFIENSTKTTNQISNGPINKLLRMISFAAFDRNNDTEIIKSLYDIEDCPDNYLPFVANLIGWNLFGSNPDRWRLQLRNAVDIYKKVGTKSGLQFALNSVFPKDIFDIESRITELWESYIPYLIYYSLATESEYFKSNQTWTPQLAHNMNIDSYSSSSLDDNIRLATDRILLETYIEFSGAFHIPKIDNKFYYRNREYPIPPFEEYPYYVNTELSMDMINFISDRLACFGVRKPFVLQFRDYVIENTIEVDEEIRSSSWLFFTSGYNSPPNLSNLVENLNSKKFEYTSLWSGKSSHFKLIFDASEFDFTNLDETDEGSGDAIMIASQIINEFSPAHAIPLVTLRLSSVDTLNFNYDELPIISLNPIETPESFNLVLNRESSGISLGGYKRGNSGPSFGRDTYTSLQNSLIKNATVRTGLDRTSHRRRGYEKLMPFNGYYDRTGFNPPVSWDPSASLSGLPLGFVASSLSFYPITNYSSIPDVYSICQDINSSASFFGFNVSNALKTRGHVNLGTRDYYCDRGQLPDIYAVMHDIQEQFKVFQASALYSSSYSNLDRTWMNVDQSLANSATENNNWFPSSVRDFYDFSFGLDLHKLYRKYYEHFNRHRLAEDLHYLDGPNIFSHTYGPLLFNHNFNVLGPIGSTYVTTSPSSLKELNNGGTVFTANGPGVYVASATSSMYIDKFEFVNSGILSGIELIQTSGASVENAFTIIKLANSERSSTSDDYLFEKGFIRLKSIDGLPRVRFDLRKYTCPSLLNYPISTNFLVPDCNYNLSFNSLISNRRLDSFGGRSVGVWIHTKPESGYMWSYKNNQWTIHSQTVSKQDLFTTYSNIFTFPIIDTRSQTSSINQDLRLNCITIEADDAQEIDPLLLVKKDNFTNNQIKFTTNNSDIIVPESYFKNHGQLHRINQNYIIEIFLLPTSQSQDLTLLLDKVEVQNLTFKKMSEILALAVCPEYRIELSKEQLQHIFRFWNDISGKNSNPGLASRHFSNEEEGSNNYILGGSRLDYRIDKDWATVYSGVAATKYFGETVQNVILQNLLFNI
jgi:hypothetical protein